MPDRREVQRIESGRFTRLLNFSNDGRFLAQWDGGLNLRIWRVADGESVFGDELGRCENWAFSADSHQLVAGKGDEVVRYDLGTGQESNRWRARGKVFGLSFHPDNRQLAVSYESSPVVSIFDATDATHLAELPVGAVDGQVVAWHPDGNRLAVSGGSDRRIQIWNVPAKRKVATLEGHVQQVTALAFHAGGSLLLSGGWEAVYRIWEPSSGREVLQFQHRLSAWSFSTDGRWLGAIPNGNGGQLLEVAACPEYRTFVSSMGTSQGDYFDGDISPDGGSVSAGMDDGVRVWDLASGREAVVLAIGRTGSAFFQPDGRELLTCGDAGLQRWTIHYRADAAQPLQPGSPQPISLPFTPTRACRSRDGRMLAITSESGGGALAVDLVGATVSPLLPHPGAGYVALSPDGTWLATAGWHSSLLRLWNVRTGEQTLEWKEGGMVGISFTPDSRALVVLRPDECAFWDVKTLQLIRRQRREASQYNTGVAFSPDEKLMALEVSPGVIHLTDAATGRTVAKLTDPSGDRATWMSFTPGGTQLVTTSNYAKTVHVWDLRRIRAGLKEMRLDWDWPEFTGPTVGRGTER